MRTRSLPFSLSPLLSLSSFLFLFLSLSLSLSLSLFLACYLLLTLLPSKFTPHEIADVISIGYLNGLFVLARSIGLIGHTLDQKRMEQPLYRHPMDEVMYT